MSDPFPTLPADFGRYRVLKPLGAGGMGRVYLAEDTTLGRTVALKIPDLTGQAEAVGARFLREARAAAALTHPHVCRVYDANVHAGRPYLTMEVVAGTLLSDRLDAAGPWPQPAAARLVRAVALALDAAHAAGIVHRDLKPANVMLRADDDPVVMDFGLAKRMTDAEPPGAEKVTRDGALLGTPAYMAPEQARGDAAAVGPHSDVYALGVILFELLTGRVPFEGPTYAVVVQVVTNPPPAVRAIRPDVDPRLEAICERAMAKAPRDRFPSMAAFAAALDDYLRNPGVPVPRGADATPLERPGPAANQADETNPHPDCCPPGLRRADRITGRPAGVRPADGTWEPRVPADSPPR